MKTWTGQDNGENYVKKTKGFHIRIGTPSGIVNAVYVTETHKDLANWARKLVMASHDAAFHQKSISCSMFHFTNTLLLFSCIE